MSVQEYIKAGQLDEALSVAQDDVRKAPAEAAPRVLLFQLLSILGQWERALTQLNVLKDMDANCMLLAQVFRPVLQCEALRDEVFAGRRGPLIFGEPVEWIGLLVQANQLIAQGEFPAALELRNSAFEAAEATPGTINDQPFEWIADADSRLGPLIEAIIDGKYLLGSLFPSSLDSNGAAAGSARPRLDRRAVCVDKRGRVPGLHPDPISRHAGCERQFAKVGAQNRLGS